jgi:pimeloyl-ACP methyl ester carboxylesterase
MPLEVLFSRGSGRPRPVDLLLVHGSFGGAWVWQRHFMPYLSAAGYDVHALSLRGHGGSPSETDLGRLSLSDFADDVRSVAGTLPRPMVVVGHSLGGAVVQQAVASGARFAGTVLMASVPPYGMLPANVAMFWQRPALWTELSRMLTAGARDADLEVLREGLFDNRIGAGEFVSLARRFGNESGLAVLEIQGMKAFAPFPWQAQPILVMGGTRDWFIGAGEVVRTAAWYGTAPVLLEGLSHAIMLDPDWARAAESMLAWLARFDA